MQCITNAHSLIADKCVLQLSTFLFPRRLLSSGHHGDSGRRLPSDWLRLASLRRRLAEEPLQTQALGTAARKLVVPKPRCEGLWYAEDEMISPKPSQSLGVKVQSELEQLSEPQGKLDKYLDSLFGSAMQTGIGVRTSSLLIAGEDPEVNLFPVRTVGPSEIL